MDLCITSLMTVFIYIDWVHINYLMIGTVSFSSGIRLDPCMCSSSVGT
jgi:hypothetical protein